MAYLAQEICGFLIVCASLAQKKGAKILKMIRCYLGDKVFFDGLKNYLETFQYSITQARARTSLIRDSL